MSNATATNTAAPKDKLYGIPMIISQKQVHQDRNNSDYVVLVGEKINPGKGQKKVLVKIFNGKNRKMADEFLAQGFNDGDKVDFFGKFVRSDYEKDGETVKGSYFQAITARPYVPKAEQADEAAEAPAEAANG